MRVDAALPALRLCSLGLALLGCAGRLEAPTRPADPGDAAAAGAGQARSGPLGSAAQPGFYPLRPGNRWVHRRVETATLIPDTGTGPASWLYEYTVHRRILDPIETDRRIYLPEEMIFVGPSGSWTYAIPYRQDASGLYESFPLQAGGPVTRGEAGPVAPRARAMERMIASRPVHERAAFTAAAEDLLARIAVHEDPAPAARRGWPSTAGPLEHTRLRYPLEPGARWVIASQIHPTPLAAEVMDVETLKLPPGTLTGHRIRLHGGTIRPGDSVETWYGPAGFLQAVAHYEQVVTDGQGPLGTWVYEYREVLLEVRLVGSPLSDRLPGPALPAK